jgi:hypothetical protein
VNETQLIQGRLISPEDIDQIHALIIENHKWHRTRFPIEICRLREHAQKILSTRFIWWAMPTLHACGWLRDGLRMRPNRGVGIAHQIDKNVQTPVVGIAHPKRYNDRLRYRNRFPPTHSPYILRLGWGSPTICTVVRKGLKKEMPEVYHMLDNFNWTLADIGQVQAWNAEGSDPYESGKGWVAENPKKGSAVAALDVDPVQG